MGGGHEVHHPTSDVTHQHCGRYIRARKEAYQMRSWFRFQRGVRGSSAWGAARSMPIFYAPIRVQSSVASPHEGRGIDLWSMLQEERQAAREQQAHLRSKDEELRILLEKKDEDLRILLEKKDEDLRSKDEDLRSKDTLLAAQAQKLSEMNPLISQLQWRQFELLRYKNIVDCRGALEFVASQIGMQHAGDENGWLVQFDGLLSHVLTSCNTKEKVIKDNGGRHHTSASLAAKVKAIWKRTSSDLHIGEKFKSKGTKVVLCTNGLSYSDVLTLSCLFASVGIDAEIQLQPRAHTFDES